METTTTLEMLVRVVAQARQDTAAAQAAVSQARHTFEAEHMPLFATLDAARTAQEQAESALREAVLAAFIATGNKRPHPAVGVRVYTRLVYDPAAVTAWARENMTPLLVLDTKRFEQVAPHLGVPGVTISPEPQATIAQDLDLWLCRAQGEPTHTTG